MIPVAVLTVYDKQIALLFNHLVKVFKGFYEAFKQILKGDFMLLLTFFFTLIYCRPIFSIDM